MDEGACCEVTSVNIIIRQSAGGSVRQPRSDQTSCQHVQWLVAGQRILKRRCVRVHDFGFFFLSFFFLHLN